MDHRQSRRSAVGCAHSSKPLKMIHSAAERQRRREQRRKKRTSTRQQQHQSCCGVVEAIVLIMTGALVLLVIVLLATGLASGRHQGGDYLYAVDDFDHGPVQELLNTTTHPEFLYNADYQNYRMVEFYAPWCGHCRHYRPKYVALARHLLNITTENNLTLSIHAVSCTVHRPICKEFMIRSYPTVKFFKAGSNNSTDVYPWSHPFQILKQAGVYDGGGGMNDVNFKNTRLGMFRNGGGTTSAKKSSGFFSSSSAQTTKQVQQHYKDKPSVFADAWLSFDFALRNSIYYENGPLSNSTAQHFSDWINLLLLTLPSAWNIHDLLQELNKNIEKVTKNETLLMEIVDKHPPPSQTWSDQCKTQGDTGAYTCGLWELFHILTVGVVEWNSHTTDRSDNIHTLDAADVLYKYISSFFACEECRVNFMNGYDNCDHDRCNRLSKDVSTHLTDWMELPLWLWETHNGVNARLSKERKENVPKQETQWPLRNDCPSCWNTDGTWREEQVYKYLRIQYWPDDGTTAVHRSQVLPLERNIQLPPWWMVGLVTLIVLPIIYGLRWYTKRLQRIRSGRHKKQESSSC